MKLTKYIYKSAAFMLAATVATACSESEILPEAAPEGETVEYVISTSLPESIHTYASEAVTDAASQSCRPPYDNVNSALGGLANLVDQGYTVRYIMEIYNSRAGRIVRQIKYKPLTAGTDYKNITFDPVRIARADETEFFFWSDIVMEVNSNPVDPGELEGAEGLSSDITGITLPYNANPYFYSNKDNKNDNTDPLYGNFMFFYTYPGDLRHIAGLGSYIPDSSENSRDWYNYNPEMWDGYAAYKKMDFSNMNGGPMNITLTRPMAKLRFVATDADILAGDSNVNWRDFDIELNNQEYGQIPSIMPAYDMAGGTAELFPGKILNTSGSWYEYANIATGYWSESEFQNRGFMPMYSADTDKLKTIAVVYLPGQPNAVNIKAKFYNPVTGSANDNILINLDLPNVPLVANKLTTIKGNFLSKDHNFSITVSDDFDTPGEDVVYTGTPVSGD